MNWRRVENEKRVWGGRQREDPDRTTSIVQNENPVEEGRISRPAAPALRRKRRKAAKADTDPPTTPPKPPRPEPPRPHPTCRECGDKISPKEVEWHRRKDCRTRCPACERAVNTKKFGAHRSKCPNRPPVEVIYRDGGMERGRLGPSRPIAGTVACEHCLQRVPKKKLREHLAECPKLRR